MANTAAEGGRAKGRSAGSLVRQCQRGGGGPVEGCVGGWWMVVDGGASPSLLGGGGGGGGGGAVWLAPVVGGGPWGFWGGEWEWDFLRWW